MATTPVYTTKAAIIIGAVVSLGAGLAIGATFLASMIDANSLQEYRENPKVSNLVILNDDAAGHSAGWNPGINEIEYQESPGRTVIEKREQIAFTIKDGSVTSDSIIYAVHTENKSVYTAQGVSPGIGIVQTQCSTVPAEGSFTAYCGTDWATAKEGSQLRYYVITPS